MIITYHIHINMDVHEFDVDSDSLKILLNDILEDISDPYLERREKCSSCVPSPIEELTNAIQEISKRERELHAAIGISFILIQNNEILKKQLVSTEAILREKETESHITRQRVNELESQMKSSQSNQNSLINELQQTERLLSSQRRPHKSLDITLESTLQKPKENNKEIEGLRIKIETFCHENSLLNNKLSSSERVMHSLKENLESISEENDQLIYQNSSILAQVKRLKTQYSITKQQECSDLYQENNVPDFPTLSEELSRILPVCSTEILKGILISTSKDRRKDPSEEYFILTSQAVKLNSPYMETICTISGQNLYQEAIKQCIPFHKWYVWIENQLNRIYIKFKYSSPIEPRPYKSLLTSILKLQFE